MNSARLWTLGAVVAILALLGGAAGLGVQPLLAAAAAADATTATTNTQNAASRVELARLTRVAATQSALEAQSADLELAIPSALQLNTFTRDIRKIAERDGVTLDSIVPAAGTAYVPPVTAEPAATATPAATDGEAAAPAPAETADPRSPWFGATDPMVTSDNFVLVPVSIVVKGTAAATTAFATDVQQGDRVFAVNSFTSTTNPDGVTTAVLGGVIYAIDR